MGSVHEHDNDQLLNCLLILGKQQQKQLSRKSLVCGLPLENNQLTVALFNRAAKRAGFNSMLMERKISDISSLLMPVVLILEDNKAYILLEVSKSGQARLILPEGDGRETLIPLHVLERQYTGYCFFVQKNPEIEDRAKEYSSKKAFRYKWFFSVLLRYKRLYAEVILAAVMINILVIASPLFTMNVYDRVVPNEAQETLWVMVIAVSIAFIFDWLLRIIRAYYIDLAGKRADLTLSSLIFEQVLNIRMENRPKSSGSFASIIRDFDTVRDFFTSASITTLIDIPFVFLFMGVLFMIGGKLALVLPAVAICILLLNLLVQPTLAKVVNEHLEETTQKHAILIESITGLEQVKAMGAQSVLQSRWESIIGKLAHTAMKSRFISSFSSFSTMWIQQMSTVIIIIIGVHMIFTGDLSLGGLIACTILTGRAAAPLNQIASLATRYQQAKSSLDSINNIMHSPMERNPEKNAIYNPEIDGEIEFDNVSFNYPEQEQLALDGVSFKIQPKEKVAIIGRIGSGKSTIQKLIMGLYHPSSGNIFIDGVDQHQIDVADLRSNIGYIPQDPNLFYGTIRENILMAAPNADDESILKAIEISGLSQVIMKQKMGLDLPIGEYGCRLSCGQRQLVSITRGLVNDAPVILLDEPTSSQDSNSEASFIQRAIKAFEDKTVIIVTHKMPLLQMVDRVIVVENGKIVADGPKEEIIGSLAGKKTKSQQVKSTQNNNIEKHLIPDENKQETNLPADNESAEKVPKGDV